MPFRQLPATNPTRLKAMQAAANKAAVVDPAELAFSSDSKTKLDTILPQFETEVGEAGQALASQSQATKKVTARKRRLKMWCSHFFQNLNMGIERGVLQASDRAFYQLNVSQTTLPSMSTEGDLLLWAGRVVSGETARTAGGGTPLPFPSSAEVDAEREQYTTLQQDQSNKMDTYDAEQEDVDAMLDEVDALIEDIWDEVEFKFRRDDPPSLRRKAREYGVYYALRPGEQPDPDEPPAS